MACDPNGHSSEIQTSMLQNLNGDETYSVTPQGALEVDKGHSRLAQIHPCPLHHTTQRYYQYSLELIKTHNTSHLDHRYTADL